MKPYPARIAERLIPAIEQLRQEAQALELAHEDRVHLVNPAYRESACNLLHYLALRQSDIRKLQEDLSLFGLSRLGRAGAHVMFSFDAILTALHALCGRAAEGESLWYEAQRGIGHALLNEHPAKLLGPLAGKRPTRIMVTMPSEACRS